MDDQHLYGHDQTSLNRFAGVSWLIFIAIITALVAVSCAWYSHPWLAAVLGLMVVAFIALVYWVVRDSI